MPDLNGRELAMLGSIAAVVLWMGVYPESFIAPMRQDVGTLLARIERVQPPGDAPLIRASAPAPSAAAPAGNVPQAAAGDH
jgi:NADH-quinone oxidoreductase subunit M